MRHRRAVKKLSRNTSNRKALLRSLVANLILHERISTTHGKAKEASILTDKLITLGKKNTITAKKNAISVLGSKLLINKLFDDIAPRFTNRVGGYTRVLQVAHRKGDGAKMAILELTEKKVIEKTPPKKKRTKQAEEKLKEEQKTPSKEEKKPHAVPAALKTATLPGKEKTDEEKSKEKAKSEKEKLKKGFFKGLRRYFRGRSV